MICTDVLEGGSQVKRFFAMIKYRSRSSNFVPSLVISDWANIDNFPSKVS